MIVGLLGVWFLLEVLFLVGGVGVFFYWVIVFRIVLWEVSFCFFGVRNVWFFVRVVFREGYLELYFKKV